MDNFSRISYLLVTIVGVLAIWSAITELGLVNASLFPGPQKILMAFVEMSKTGELIVDSAASLISF